MNYLPHYSYLKRKIRINNKNPKITWFKRFYAFSLFCDIMNYFSFFFNIFIITWAHYNQIIGNFLQSRFVILFLIFPLIGIFFLGGFFVSSFAVIELITELLLLLDFESSEIIDLDSSGFVSLRCAWFCLLASVD